jgi:hypothetical protein
MVDPADDWPTALRTRRCPSASLGSHPRAKERRNGDESPGQFQNHETGPVVHHGHPEE